MTVSILHGDCRETLKGMEAESVHCIVTSPPYYGLRDYGVDGQIGLEETPEAYVAEMVSLFREARRVLREDGTLWLNLGDSYASVAGGYSDTGSRGTSASISAKTQSAVRKGTNRTPPTGLKAKDLIGIPWRVAFALQAEGWYLRQDIIWHKPNPMPESVTDRCTKSHEYVFLLAKSSKYYYDAEALREENSPTSRPWTPKSKTDASEKTNAVGAGHDGKRSVALGDGRNKRSVWSISTQAFSEAHFATMPPELAETCIKAGCPLGGTVLDPFGGAGTTGLMADRLGRNAVLCELNPEYIAIAKSRIEDDAGMFAAVA